MLTKDIFRQTNSLVHYLTKLLTKMCEREFRNFYIVLRTLLVWKLQDFPLTIFEKNSVKSTFWCVLSHSLDKVCMFTYILRTT